MYITYQAYKATKDDWYPNYFKNEKSLEGTNGLVRVKFTTLYTKPESWRVCVWGDDDTGMEKDFPPNKKDEAFACFIAVICLEYVNRDILETMGFIPA